MPVCTSADIIGVDFCVVLLNNFGYIRTLKDIFTMFFVPVVCILPQVVLGIWKFSNHHYCNFIQISLNSLICAILSLKAVELSYNIFYLATSQGTHVCGIVYRPLPRLPIHVGLL